MVPTMSLARIFPAFPETPAGMFVEHAIDGIDDFGITILSRRCSVMGRPRQANAAATALH